MLWESRQACLSQLTGECEKQTLQQVSEIFKNFGKFSEIFGILRKSSENFENCCKVLLKNNISAFLKFF